MKYVLEDLLDKQNMQELLESFCEIVGLSSSIIDLDGNVVISANWQRICSEFHRENTETSAKCIESDTSLANQVDERDGYTLYSCKNGLNVASVPIILKEQHLANLFVGQFFLEEPDIDFFEKQARQFGFSQKDYLAAVNEVPRVTNEKLTPILKYLGQFSQTLARIALDNSERNVAEKDLLELNTFNEQIVKSAQEGVVVYGLDLRYQLWNPFMERITGKKAEEVLGKHPKDLFPFLQESGVLENLKRALQGESILSDDFPFEVPGTGIKGWASDVSSPLKDASGTIVGVIAFVREISGRKQIEEDLRTSQELSQTVLNAINEPISLINIDDFTIVDTNSAFVNLYGEPKEGVTCFEATHFRKLPCLPPTDPCPLQETIKTGRVASSEHIHSDLKGNNIFAEVATFPVLNQAGELKQVVHVSRDVTERKKAEKELRDSEEKYRSLLELTSTVPWGVDLVSGEFTYIGVQVVAMLGYPADSWVDIDAWAARIHPEDRAEAVNYCMAETQKGNDHEFEYRAMHQDGSFRWIRDVVSVVHGVGGPEKLVGFLHDITEQKELGIQNEKLEKQYTQSQRLEAIGTLAGGIAHDFNNILGVMLGFSEMALDEVPDGSDLESYLKKIVKAGDRAKELVHQILTFSRQSQIDRIPLNPTPIVKEALKMLRSSIPSTIAIKQKIAANCGNINANPTQLHQVLMNICTNAYHAMEETGGTLNVEMGVAEPPLELRERDEQVSSNYVELVISDTGHGIGEDVIEMIFDPFFTTKDKEKGTGMGLAITYGIIKEYGGAITVESQVGVGTIFHIYLPQSTGQEPLEDQIDLDIPIGNEHILLVDDEELLAEMGKNMLEKLGYKVTVSLSSSKALEIFTGNPSCFDLVLTDQTMPGLTGIQLSKEMLGIRSDIPIILCTGYSNLVDEEVARAQGIKEFAYKPLTKRTLSSIVRHVLDSVCP